MKLVQLFEFLLLITAFWITLTSSIESIVRTYRVQSVLLAVVTASTAWEKLQYRQGDPFGLDTKFIVLGMILVLPLLLAVFSKELLLRATLSVNAAAAPRERKLVHPAKHGGQKETNAVFWGLPSAQESDEYADAKRTWRDVSEKSLSIRALDVIAFIAIVALAAWAATLFSQRPSDKIPRPIDETLGLTVSLSLHLVGLYIMTAKRDLISQTVGLLVMDHGLYLTIVKIVAVPVPALSFVIGLWFYTVITFVILVFMVPQIQRREGIDLATIARESDLKG
jgi:hydrogenase-4 membrane subunit HyfE